MSVERPLPALKPGECEHTRVDIVRAEYGGGRQCRDCGALLPPGPPKPPRWREQPSRPDQRLLTQRPQPYHQRPGGLDVCAYCGAVLGGRDEAEAHIRTCPQHPLSALTSAAQKLEAAWDALCRCVDEFEPEDMAACAERRGDLDDAVLRVIDALHGREGGE